MMLNAKRLIFRNFLLKNKFRKSDSYDKITVEVVGVFRFCEIGGTYKLKVIDKQSKIILKHFKVSYL